jgi:hypothetical protein
VCPGSRPQITVGAVGKAIRDRRHTSVEREYSGQRRLPRVFSIAFRRPPWCAPSLLGQYSNHVELIVARHANKEKLCKRKIVLFNFTGYPREIDQINIRYGDKTRCISAGIFLLIPLR